MRNLLRKPAYLLIAITAFAFLLRVATALSFPNTHHPDEVYQYLEQAHRLVYGYGFIPWEYGEGLRSWILPGFLALVMGAGEPLAGGSLGYSLGVYVVLSLISCSVVVVAFLWGLRSGGLLAAIIGGGLAAVWFELVYFAPKPLTEVLAAHTLLPALYLADTAGEKAKLRLFAVGLGLGLVLALRFHLAPAVGFAMLYICRTEFRQKWLPLGVGTLVVLVASGLLDWLTWSYPFQPIVKIIYVNLFEGRQVKMMGTQPFFFYPAIATLYWSGALVPILFFALLGARRIPLPAILAIIVVLSHSFVPHKEYRFVYPAIALIIPLVGVGTAEVAEAIRARFSPGLGKALVAGCVVMAWGLTSLSLAIGSDYRLYWSDYSGRVLAFREISTKQDVCGVATIGYPRWATGGYVSLHQDVPVFISEQPQDVERVMNFANYLVVPAETAIPDQAFEKQRCWREGDVLTRRRNEVCLYRRPGACAADLDEVSEMLLQPR